MVGRHGHATWSRRSLETLPDPRSRQGRIYPLACLIALAPARSPPPGTTGSPLDSPLPPDFPERTGLTGRPDVTRTEVDGDQLRVHSREPEGLLGALVSLASYEGLHIRDASQLKPSLETVFLTLTGREYRE